MMIMRILMTLVCSSDHDDYEEFEVAQGLDPAILANSEIDDCYEGFYDTLELPLMMIIRIVLMIMSVLLILLSCGDNDQ